MKNRFVIFLISAVGSLLVFSSCKKSFLDADPKGLFLESNYYSTAYDAYTVMVAAYNPLGWEFVHDYLNKQSVNNSLGDECYAGGGGATDINELQACNTYTLSTALGPQGDLWNRNFTGVYRCNLMIQKLGGTISGLTADVQKRYIAEAKCLRAYYYFDLVRYFGNVPLFTAPVPTDQIYTVTQAKPADVYVQ